MVMDWLGFVGNLINRVPFERILFPPRDSTKELQKLLATLPSTEAQKEGASEEKSTPTIQQPAKAAKTVATACVPCALGHFSTSAGLLNEIARFKGDGITSDEILDRVAKVQAEQNALERVDLTPENIQALPPWEKELAEGALSQSRKLRHSIESFTSIAQLNQAAADTSSFYKELNRKWFKGRFAHLGPEKAQRIADEVGKLSTEDKERIMKRAEELIEVA
ncbi:unnamed protein product [marine sediment metagenome]|uniref:Uncharacterized protein n=1 Tax=marine sediment metagenome TaxID=412755 RepID=X1HP39_9ZZZZ